MKVVGDLFHGRIPEGAVYVGRATPDLVQQARAELAGRDLACWCALDRPCHADILLEAMSCP